MIIKGGRIVDPKKGDITKQDILIEDGKIARMVPSGELHESGSGVRVINAKDRLITPGLIDMHVHLREPGHEYKETVATGCMAGAAGGFTGIACMPNTDPINDNNSVTEFILRQAVKANSIRVYPIAAITKGSQGERLTEFGDLRGAGAIGVSDDGFSVVSSELMRRALEYARYHDLTVISHCEDRDISAKGVMHEGDVSTKIGLAGIPSAGEEIMVQREISLARLTGCPVHIAHVSTKESVNAIRRAKEDGVLVTSETAPHYFSLDHTAVIGYNTNTKMNPPLRTPEDVEAIKQGLVDGTIDVIATDHAPHSPLEKELEFDKAAFGIIGLETALPLTLDLVRDGLISLPLAIKKMSIIPAEILGIEAGIIKEGVPADIAIIDPEEEYVLKEGDLQSKSRNSPFLGRVLKGRNILTIVEGRIVYSRDSEYSDS